MKIAILTFWWSEDNYGQLLQCYALQEYLRERGNDVGLIRYRYEDDYIPDVFWKKVLRALNPVYVFRHFQRNKKKRRESISRSSRCFEEFRDEYLKFYPEQYASYDQLVKNPPRADLYIVGSDQVWRVAADASDPRCRNIVNAYLLNFGPESVRRMSYAASFGVDDIGKKSAAVVAPLFKRFESVSVREKNGIRLCQRCGCDNAEWDCDPTMLLPAATYREIYGSAKIRKPSGPFLLLYMLNNECGFDIAKAYGFAETKGLEVIYVTGNGPEDDGNSMPATIPEWLYLVDHADYVITNSYHGSVFSAIFGTKFGVIRLRGRAVGANARFASLFERYQIAERYITDTDLSALEQECTPAAVQESSFFDKL